MEANHENHTLLSIILGAIGILTEVCRRLVNNYDVAFKLLTLTMLTLAIVVNLDKAIRVLYSYVKSILQWIKTK